MFGSEYQFKPEPAYKGIGKAIVQWFKNSKLGWKWLMVVLPFSAISAWTNIVGLSLALSPVPALVFGIAIQIALLYACIQMIHSRDEHRSRWTVPVVAIMALSVFFSFAGFTSFYSGTVDAQIRPMRMRDDLKKQASTLAGSIAEAKELAGSKLTNRIDDARVVMSRVRAKERDGQYFDPAVPAGMIAEQEELIEAAEEARDEWNAFSFNPQEALDQKEVSAGFAVLQSAHARLSQLMGTLRKHERDGYRMPSAPVASINAAEEAPRKALVEHALSQIATLGGLFWLFLAFLLEAVPFWLAKANRAPSEEEEIAIDADPEMPPVLRPAGHPLLVQPVTGADEEIARQISDEHAIARAVCHVWATEPAEIERQSARVDVIAEGVRKVYLERLQSMLLIRSTEERMKRLEHMVASLRKLGMPEREIQSLVKSACDEIVKDYNVGDLGLERLREERRDAAIQPSTEWA